MNPRSYRPHRFSVLAVVLACVLFVAAYEVRLWFRDEEIDRYGRETELVELRASNFFKSRKIDRLTEFHIELPEPDRKKATERLRAIFARMEK